MPRNSTLTLRTESLADDCIWLESPDAPPETMTVPYEMDVNEAPLAITFDPRTGDVARVVLEQASRELPSAVGSLRMNLLPWTFSLPELELERRPLEDILHAVYVAFLDGRDSVSGEPADSRQT